MPNCRTLPAFAAALALGASVSLWALPQSAAIAQETVVNDNGVYGENVARADFPGGSYRMIGEREWGRFDENGQMIRTYVEVTRDDWAAEFRDPATNTYAIIDTLRLAVSETDPTTNVLTQFANITAVAPRGDKPRVALPRIPADYPQWYKDAWNKRFSPTSQGWQAGQSVAMSSGQGTFAIGPAQPLGGQQSGQAVQGGQPSDPGVGGYDFNPFSAPPPASAPPSGGPGQQTNPFAPPPAPPVAPPAWAQGNDQQSSNPFSAPGGSRPPFAAPPPAVDRGDGGFDAQAGQEEAPHSLIEGVWVEQNARISPNGDGERSAITWSSPKYLRFLPLDDTSVAILMDETAGWNVLRKQSDTSYSGSGITAAISEARDTLYLSVSGGRYSGRYEIARTADGGFSRDRFEASDRDSRRGLFNQDGLTREWNTNFFSFDGPDMNLFDPLAGRKLQIFKQPGNFDYAIDDNLNLGLPFGLRGFRTRMSSSRQTETLITNAAAFQNDMSMNFGGGISTPKASFGASYSYEKTQGARSSSSSMSALGFARIERYTLILDEPNAELSENFKRSVEDLASGRMNADNFVATFGTHYAKAISFGGLGKAEKSMTSTQVAEYLSERSSYSASGGAKGATLQGGFSEGRSSENSSESVFSRDEFQAVGGSGSMSFNGWTVTDGDTVPVRYDLRRLSDLVTPIFFDMKSSNDMNRYLQAKNALRAAIDRRMNNTPPFSDRYAGPTFYEIELHQLRCTNRGDEKTNTVTLRGSMELSYADDTGPKQIPLFNNATGEAMTCGGAGKNLGIKPLVILSAGSRNAGSPSYGAYSIAANLTEVDEGPPRSTSEEVRDGFITGLTLGLANKAVRDNDDIIDGSTMLLSLQRDANGQRRTQSFGRNPAPTLVLDYTIREIK
jgi:hypothetical protein